MSSKSVSNYVNSARELNVKGILRVMPSWLELIVIVLRSKRGKGVGKLGMEQGAVRVERSLICSESSCARAEVEGNDHAAKKKRCDGCIVPDILPMIPHIAGPRPMCYALCII